MRGRFGKRADAVVQQMIVPSPAAISHDADGRQATSMRPTLRAIWAPAEDWSAACVPIASTLNVSNTLILLFLLNTCLITSFLSRATLVSFLCVEHINMAFRLLSAGFVVALLFLPASSVSAAASLQEPILSSTTSNNGLNYTLGVGMDLKPSYR